MDFRTNKTWVFTRKLFEISTNFMNHLHLMNCPKSMSSWYWPELTKSSYLISFSMSSICANTKICKKGERFIKLNWCEHFSMKKSYSFPFSHGLIVNDNSWKCSKFGNLTSSFSTVLEFIRKHKQVFSMVAFHNWLRK